MELTSKRCQFKQKECLLVPITCKQIKNVESVYFCIFQLVFACENDDYLIDGGVSSNEVGTSTFNYLQSHAELDTFAILLERAGLANDIDATTTVFVGIF